MTVSAWGAEVKIPKPTPAQVRWQNCEIGVIYHLDMPVVAGDYSRNNATRKTFDPKLYNPAKLDTDQGRLRCPALQPPQGGKANPILDLFWPAAWIWEN